MRRIFAGRHLDRRHPDEVARKLRELSDAVGGFGTLLVIGHEWEPREAWLRSMSLLTQHVLPRL
jgi:alkanesulfonate monooxygenase SsuD/methylene tetrahydromethanopterin reductase-like flavin-dependent oxidoreductase (luciferase family)